MTPQEYFDRAQEHVKNCNLCGSEQEAWATLAIRDRLDFPVHQVICLKCGLSFITPRMSAQDYVEFYETGEYRRLVNSRIDSGIPLHKSQSNYAKSVSSLMKSILSDLKGSTMLDVGGSTGVISDQLQQDYGIVPTVLDLAKGEIEIASAKNIEVIFGSVDTFDPGKRRWDIVGIFQSIDHFLNPRAALSKVREWMNPQGLLIVDVCDLRFTIPRYGGVEQACKIDHPFAFTEHTMRAYMEQIGFAPVMVLRCEPIAKTLFVCRRGVPNPGTLPDLLSVVHLFAIAHKKRLEQRYETSNKRAEPVSA